MDNIISSLRRDQLVVDLGCGRGSFGYATYDCKIVGIDVRLEPRTAYFDGERVSYVQADSHAIPIASASTDAVVCNHSLEHVVQYRATLAEIRRILKPTGLLWISVPNGFGFDDGLYRFLYAGGGHVNRFTFTSLKDSVEEITGLSLLQSSVLISSFIYCKRPTASEWPYLPRRLKLLHQMRIGFIPFLLNAGSRLIDQALHTRLSVYGWGFVFGLPQTVIEQSLPSYFNVCLGCGSGHQKEKLAPFVFKRWGFQLYECPQCRERNLFFRPPKGFQ